MSNMTLFGNTSVALQGIEDTLTGTLAGNSGGGNRRISIEGGVFREIVGGKEVRQAEGRAIDVVIVNAAPVSRMFFQGTYVKGQKTKPTCWSSDSQKPDAAVPAETRQAVACKDCPQHIRGSGQGESRACRFQQRIAVALASDDDVSTDVYQITLPSTSVFGDPEGKKMPLQAYGRHLKAHNTPAISIVTEVRFDTNSATPKLVFSPKRPLSDDEISKVIPLQKADDTIRAITLNVSQMDGVIEAPKQPTKADLFESAPAPKAAKVEAEEVEEPKKVVKKTAEVTEKADLSDIVGEWDD